MKKISVVNWAAEINSSGKIKWILPRILAKFKTAEIFWLKWVFRNCKCVQNVHWIFTCVAFIESNRGNRGISLTQSSCLEIKKNFFSN